MRGYIFRSIGALAALLMVSGVQGATVFSSTPTIIGASESDVSAFGGSKYNADNFSLSSGATITSITWRGIYFSANTIDVPDDFTVKFYSDFSGLPGSEIGSFSIGVPDSRIDTLDDVYTFRDIYEYTADLGAGISLSPSTEYWISIYGDTAGDIDDAWHWGVGPGFVGATAAFSETDQSSWASTTGNRYFELQAVPIPAAFYLFGSALGLLGWMRRKKT